MMTYRYAHKVSKWGGEVLLPVDFHVTQKVTGNFEFSTAFALWLSA